jgi:hypothetical protein
VPGALATWVAKQFRTGPSPQAAASGASLGFNGKNRVGKPDARLYRNWAEHGEWVRAAVNFIKTQVSQSEWDIVPNDKDRRFDKGLARELRDLFNSPTTGRPTDAVIGDSFRAFIEPIIEDLLVLDAGVIEKERTLGGDLYALHGVDGGRVLVSTVWDNDPLKPRYWFQRSPVVLVPFLNADMVYMMSNPRTYMPVGLSALETLKYTIDGELNSSAYNTRQVTNAAPDGLLDIGEGARPEQVDAFKSYWLAEVAGRGAMAFIGGTKGAKFVPFRQSNRDMQFLEWNIYLVRKICAVFGLSPQDLGVTFDINRATGEVQADKTEARGIRPVLSLTQDFATREIVWDKAFKGPKNNLAFRFTRLNIKESLDKAQINKLALAGVPWKAVNEARLDEGRLPFGDPMAEDNPYNRPMANTPLGIVSLEDINTAADVSDPAPPAPAGGTAPKTPAKRRSREPVPAGVEE